MREWSVLEFFGELFHCLLLEVGQSGEWQEHWTESLAVDFCLRFSSGLTYCIASKIDNVRGWKATPVSLFRLTNEDSRVLRGEVIFSLDLGLTSRGLILAFSNMTCPRLGPDTPSSQFSFLTQFPYRVLGFPLWGHGMDQKKLPV